MDSGFDVLPFGDLVDLAAVAADDALIEALAGRTPGGVPPAADPVAELLAKMLAAAWVAEAWRGLPAWEALSTRADYRAVPVVRPCLVPRQPQQRSWPVAPGIWARLAHWLRAAAE